MATYKFKPVFNKINNKTETANNQTEIEYLEYIQLTDIKDKDKKDRCEAVDAYLTFSNSCGSSKQSNVTKIRRRL